jgi:hypothetical protein
MSAGPGEVDVLTGRHRIHALAASALLAGLLAMPQAAAAQDVPTYDFATPVFGLATAVDGLLLAADAGAGVVRLGPDRGKLIVELTSVTDVAPIGNKSLWAVTSRFAEPADTDGHLLRVLRGKVVPVADLFAFEEEENPDGDIIESNPFDVMKLSRSQALVADAAGNSLLIADANGNLDWVATLPPEVVSSQDAKDLVGCPDPPPDLEWVCELPPMMETHAVATSVTMGPDGAYYVGELKGFPAPLNESRIWRIEPGSRHVHCSADGRGDGCSIVADGFTSVIDLTVGGDGTIYVTELDENSWFALEVLDGKKMLGGTVNGCDPATWSCTEVATGLPMSMATTVAPHGVFTAINVLIPGAAEVVRIA